MEEVGWEVVAVVCDVSYSPVSFQVQRMELTGTPPTRQARASQTHGEALDGPAVDMAMQQPMDR